MNTICIVKQPDKYSGNNSYRDHVSNIVCELLELGYNCSLTDDSRTIIIHFDHNNSFAEKSLFWLDEEEADMLMRFRYEKTNPEEETEV